MSIIIDNDLRVNKGFSQDYNNIIKMIVENKMDHLDDFVKEKSLDRCYKIVSEKFKLKEIKKFHQYLYSDCYIQYIEKYYPKLKNIYIHNDIKSENISSKYMIDHASLLPEGLLNIDKLEEISEYITNFNDSISGLEYVFNNYGFCMYNQECAQILRNMYKVIDKDKLDNLFEYLKYFTANTDINILFYFIDIKYIFALNKLLEIKQKEEICEVFFNFITIDNYNKNNYKFNKNIYKLFDCILNDCEHYKYKRTNKIINHELKKSRKRVILKKNNSILRKFKLNNDSNVNRN
jgi:hypothetical protein